MTLLAVFLLCQDPAADIDRLVRELADERIEVRERAHARLLESGVSAIPALSRAADSVDAELRIRAGALLERVKRIDGERTHDADQLAALLKLHRDIPAESRPGSAASKGARFDVSTAPFEDGWVITTLVTDYLARSSAPGPGRGLLDFEFSTIADADGREVAVERCGRCSPRKILVRSPAGPWKAHLTGNQTWFSPYHLEFKEPAVGHSKRVGDFKIEVTGLELKVSTPASFSWDSVGSMNTSCEFELRPGVEIYRPRMGIARCGGMRCGVVAKKAAWCDCPDGPQPVRPRTSPAYISEFAVGKAIEVRQTREYEGAVEERPLKLEDYARITYTFWKPIEIPIDITVTVQTK